MDKREVYVQNRNKEAYDYFLAHKFFKKARAIIVDGDEVLLIKCIRPDGKSSYVLPGGGVESGETTKAAAVRESFEEYGVVVKNPVYIGRHYYSCPMNYDSHEFKSNRVEFFYLCEVDGTKSQSSNFGLEGEFSEKGNTYQKVRLPLSALRSTDPNDLNKMAQNVFEKLLEKLGL